VDCRTTLPVDFDFVTVATRQREGDFKGHQEQKECERLLRMIPNWNDDDRIALIVRDEASKSALVIATSGWNVAQLLDTNHCVKAFIRKWDAFPLGDQTLLFGLKERLKRFSRHIVRLQLPPDRKITTWRNAILHHQGDGSQCPVHQYDTHEWKARTERRAIEVLQIMLDDGGSTCYPRAVQHRQWRASAL